MSDGYATSFPIGKAPDPDDFSAEYVDQVADAMARTRMAVAPNPLAQAMYPPLRPTKRLDEK